MTSQLVQLDRISPPTKEEFVREYLRPGKPVVIEGLVDHWPAIGKWTPEFFAEELGDVTVPVRMWPKVGDRPNSGESYLEHAHEYVMTVRDFVQMLDGYHPECPPYLSSLSLPDHLPSLMADRLPFPYYRTWQAWPERYYTAFLWFGATDTVTPVHWDIPNNFYVQVYGSKRVLLFPVSETENFYYRPDHRAPFISPVDAEQREDDNYPRLRNASGYTADVGAGDVLFIPSCFWHYLRALETSLALTNSFVTPKLVAKFYPQWYWGGLVNALRKRRGLPRIHPSTRFRLEY